MTEEDGFDARLAAHFERAHRQVPADAFVESLMKQVRARRRRSEFLRVGLRVAALVMAAVASPWLIDGAEYVNAALDSSLPGADGLPGGMIVAALAVVAVLAMRALRR